jgi:hypothetical protein
MQTFDKAPNKNERIISMYRFRALLALLFVVLPLLTLRATPASAQQPADYAIPNGRFFTQAGGGLGGFSVVDDGQARFWSEFQRLGLQNVGYPISQRFMYEGFVTQAFQKLVLQWRPEVNQAYAVNVFDELNENGYDQRLFETRQTPYHLTNLDAPGATWNQIVANRQALLNANTAIRQRYFSVRDPLMVFGLPTSRLEDMGNHYAIRTQRAVLQQWKQAVPWAAAGQVTVANGGDIAKEMGWLSGAAIVPEAAPGQGGPTPTPPPAAPSAWSTKTMLVGPGTPGRLYAFQLRNVPVPAESRSYTEYRLLVSDDQGARWTPYQGGIPFSVDCTYDVTMDFSAEDTLYATTCQGFYKWTGSAWTKIADQGNAVTPGNPQQLWALTTSSVLRSDDGGTTWVEAAANMVGGSGGLGTPGEIIVTTGRPTVAFAMLGVGRSGTTILRAMPGGEWVPLFPEPSELVQHPYDVQLHRPSGMLYLSAPARKEIWRITNPTTPDVAQVQWERVSSVASLGKEYVRLLAAGWSSQGAALYINASDSMGTSGTTYRSLDGGQTWQPITFP